MSPKGVSITVYPRLHLSLLDLSRDGYRRNGGIGFAIDAPLSTLYFVVSRVTDLTALLTVEYSQQEVEKLTKKIDKIRADLGFNLTIRLNSVTPFPRHAGLGSGTAVCLSCFESLFLINGQNAKRDELQKLSGRGGVSGVGINVYFDGGLVCDLGTQAHSDAYIPSDAIDEPRALPLPLISIPMPAWEIGILTPTDISPLTLEEETSLFYRTCPLPAEIVYEMVYHAIFGVVASVFESSLERFTCAVSALQKCKWKAEEIKCHGKPMMSLLTTLKQLGCEGIGMSSVGPTLFFLAQDFDRVFTFVESELPNQRLIRTRSRNCGRDLHFV